MAVSWEKLHATGNRDDRDGFYAFTFRVIEILFDAQVLLEGGEHIVRCHVLRGVLVRTN